LGFADSKEYGWHAGWSAGGETQQKISGCSTQPTNKPWPMLEPSSVFVILYLKLFIAET
jgi:hypothetical protein